MQPETAMYVNEISAILREIRAFLQVLETSLAGLPNPLNLAINLFL
jgi:hypothetical protein